MEAFRRESVRYLREAYLPRLRKALEALPEADLWWRPHERTNSVGNLLLHLEGNVRQWIVSGLGGAPDARDRASEFAAAGGRTKADLLARLERTVLDACGVIEGLDDEALHRPRTIQAAATSAFLAVYHVVEHFSWHVGQITWIAKARGGPGHGVAFYDDARLNRARNP